MDKSEIRGISIEEGERQDQEILNQMTMKAAAKQYRDLRMSFLSWFSFYFLVGAISFLFFRNDPFSDALYNISIIIIITAGALFYSTTISGMARIAVPGAMVVANKNLHVMDDMRTSKARVYEKLGGPLQGLLYGITLLILVEL